MMARAHPTFALRPFLPADAPLLAVIFQESIEELTGDDYSAGQQAAWAEEANDLEAFAERLGGQLTLIASLGDSPVGFASLRDNEWIDMLYVHPAAARQGIASALVEALEKLAAARGAKRIAVDASDTAKPLFDKRGYVAQQRNSVPLGGEWLGNTTMQKTLAPEPRGRLQ
jgi:putative acetyltransferase